MIVAGFDIGGAHLKVSRAEDGHIVASATYAMPIWQGMDHLRSAFDAARPLYGGAERTAFTMTAELADIFPTRDAGVIAVLDEIGLRFGRDDALVYAGERGFVGAGRARNHVAAIASANWHATATLAARKAGEALFVDMGSTTTDLLALRGGKLVHHGYTDAERLVTGELVYTGFTRSFVFALAQRAPVDGRWTPLMNEYFASTADVFRVLGVLEDVDDLLPSADGAPKTLAASQARLERMVGRDAGDLPCGAWRRLAGWFAECQLRTVHDAALLVSDGLEGDWPVVAAGSGRWQLNRLAERMGRRFVDFADLIPVDPAVRSAASSAGPATAVALLAGDPDRL